MANPLPGAMMMPTNDNPLPNSTSQGLLLTVTLDGTFNRVRRTLLIPAEAHLGWLHAVLQIAMGWTNSHLHQFTFRDKTFSDPSLDLHDSLTLDESHGMVDELLVRPGDVIRYQYDFGDSWEHTIRLETTAALGKRTHARCIDGTGACPPEDCGGIMGYERLLKASSKPATKAAKEFRAWLGYDYDPTNFCPISVNSALSRLPWPSVSEERLGRLIRARLEKSRPA